MLYVGIDPSIKPLLKDVEKILRSAPEVESTSRRTHLQLGIATVTEANTAI